MAQLFQKKKKSWLTLTMLVGKYLMAVLFHSVRTLKLSAVSLVTNARVQMCLAVPVLSLSSVVSDSHQPDFLFSLRA